jgi:hypothetical protein
MMPGEYDTESAFGHHLVDAILAIQYASGEPERIQWTSAFGPL